jgi:hypothetical protein
MSVLISGLTANIQLPCPERNVAAQSLIRRSPSHVAGSIFANKPLFGTRPGGPREWYAVSPDGQRFLVNTAPEQAASAPLTAVLNWSAGLKK